MDNDTHKIRVLIYRSLRALAGLLMDFGLNAREFVELAKLAYVDAAMRKYSTTARQPSITKLVQRTGLSKHEVRRLKGRLADEVGLDRAVLPRPDGAMLQLWFTDPEYLGEDGQPRALPRGPGEGTLYELVSKAAPDITPGHAIARLLRNNHVREVGPDVFEPRRRSAHTLRNAEGLWTMLRSALMPICLTIEHNMGTTKTDEMWMQTTSYARRVPISRLPYVRNGARQRGEQAIFDIDEFMNTYSKAADSDDSRFIGVGVFYFEEDSPFENHPTTVKQGG
ncbi:MAG: DUF6502 family protein [Woeseiaceae bacterium]|nr:DUF6502 family protein [Woeseiaceae bacterium]